MQRRVAARASTATPTPIAWHQPDLRTPRPTSFDAGRAAQNMMLAAWNEGIGSCPNGIADSKPLPGVAGAADDEQVAIVPTLGDPAPPVDPERHSPDEWIARADRRPFDEVVELR
jgi:nitroreductase